MFKLLMLTKDKLLFEGSVRELKAPGKEGGLQILSRHAPLFVLLQAGDVAFTDTDGTPHLHPIRGGLLEVLDGNATLLVHPLNSRYHA